MGGAMEPPQGGRFKPALAAGERIVGEQSPAVLVRRAVDAYVYARSPRYISHCGLCLGRWQDVTGHRKVEERDRGRRRQILRPFDFAGCSGSRRASKTCEPRSTRGPGANAPWCGSTERAF
jgi:hypothetical protein